MPVIAASNFAPDDIYNAIHTSNPDMKPAKILQIVGAMAITKTTGLAGLRALVL